MTTRSLFTRKGLTGMALLGVAAITVTACGLQSSVQPPANAQASVQPNGTMAAQPGQSPIAVNCGPGQQALIRPVVIGGQAVSQVDCVAVTVPQTMAAYPQAAYPAYQPAAQAVPASYVSYPEPAPRAVSPAPSNVRRANYRTSGDYVQYEPRKRERTWQKSAVIIGSTAGIGAGVGAAAGGKKGALIGAAIGGGSAAIWDQVTRRDQ
jgi:hypothetical protein